MQPIKQLARLLEHLATAEQYLFTPGDLRGAFPGQSPGAFNALLRRAEKSGLLHRVCRGVYLYPRVAFGERAGLVPTCRIDGVTHEANEAV